MTGGNSRETILKVTFSLLIFSSLEQGANAQCRTPRRNIAIYEGDLNTLINFPSSPNGVKWTTAATTDELTTVTLVNYDHTVDPNYEADYTFSSFGLTIKKATTTAEPGHQLSTAGLYTVEFAGWDAISFKFLVVRQGPTCSCAMVNSSTIQLTCSSIYADSRYNPIAAIFTLYVDGNSTASDTPVRTVNDRYTWISTSTFTTDYNGSSTYECIQTFGQPTELSNPNVSKYAPTFVQKCSVPANACGGPIATTITSTSSPSSTTATTKDPTAYDQCFTPLRNIVVYEGTLNTMINCATGPNGTAWFAEPSWNPTLAYYINYFDDAIYPNFTGLYAINQTGLIVRNATTTPTAGGPISTAGLYFVQFTNTINTIAFKLVVIRSGPICSCQKSSTSGNVSISCTMIYADYPSFPSNVVMNCTANDGQFYTSTTPTKTLVPQDVWNSTSTIGVSNTVPATYNCLVTFASPVFTNVRDLNATATVYCEAATSSSTLTAQSSTTTLAPNRTTTLTTQSSTTTLAPNRTTKLTTQSTTSVYGQCTTPPINQAVYDGTQNTMMTCNSSTNKVSWAVFPTNDEQFSRKITNYSDTVTPSLATLYGVAQTNLTIKTAQSTPATPPIATSGLYVAQYSPSGTNNKIGAKLVAVRQPPTCNCIAINSTNNNITCSFTYADSSCNPIYAKATWTADGVFIKNDTLNRRTRVNNAFTSTSTITTRVDDPRTYECKVSFTKPMNITIPYMAKNVPAFSAFCTAP